MARNEVVIRYTSATDDITGLEYKDDAADAVTTYQFIITPMTQIKVGTGKAATMEWVSVEGAKPAEYIKDVHADTYAAITALLDGDYWAMFKILTILVFETVMGNALVKWADNREDDTNKASLLSLLGGVVKGTKSKTSNGKREPKDAYYFHIREWKLAMGKSKGIAGRLTTESIMEFVTMTGINREKFEAGERAVLPVIPTDATSTNEETSTES